MKTIREYVPGLLTALFTLFVFGVLIADGVEYYKLTRGVVWNNDLCELRHKYNYWTAELELARSRLAYEQLQDAVVEKTFGHERTTSKTFEYLCDVNHASEFRERYRTGHNRTLAAVLGRDLWIAHDPELFRKAYQASAL